MLRTHGFYTAGITPFASRHSAWYFYCGFNEIHDTGKFGDESAHDILPIAEKWLDEKGSKDNWYLHVNFWDPHTPYRVPVDYENQFKNDDIPLNFSSIKYRQHLRCFISGEVSPEINNQIKELATCLNKKVSKLPSGSEKNNFLENLFSILSLINIGYLFCRKRIWPV